MGEESQSKVVLAVAEFVVAEREAETDFKIIENLGSPGEFLYEWKSGRRR